MPIVEIKDLREILPPNSRLLGVDHAPNRIGLALSTPDWSMATPFRVLMGKNFTENLKTLAIVCKEYDVRGFVIGLPFNMDGTTGPRAQSVRTFASNLMKQRKDLGFDPLIAFFDERLSTFEAEDILIEDLQMKGTDRRDVIDAMAAAEILKGALKIISA